MPAYKRQHFLPSVYLKNFSPDGSRSTRDSKVWRVDQTRCTLVPVQSQCAGDYLFSKTAPQKSEEEFQEFEKGYAAALTKIWCDGDPTVFEYFALILAAFDLYTRNIVHENRTGLEGVQAYQFRIVSFINRLIVGNFGAEALPLSELFERLKQTWGVRLFRTPTGREIITSDHPVLCFTWGAGETIDFLLLPVTPNVCAVVFDKRTARPQGNTLVETDGVHLVEALASHCHSCIYAASQPSEQAIDAFRRLINRRVIPRTVTDAEKWSLNLTVPPRPDIFSFIRPFHG